MYRSLLECCTLTNKAVGAIWRALSKTPRGRQSHDPRPQPFDLNWQFALSAAFRNWGITFNTCASLFGLGSLLMVPELCIWSILLIKSDLKWCLHLSRSLFSYLMDVPVYFWYTIIFIYYINGQWLQRTTLYCARKVSSNRVPKLTLTSDPNLLSLSITYVWGFKVVKTKTVLCSVSTRF